MGMPHFSPALFRIYTDITFIASPHVAGLAAYLMAFQGITDPAEVVTLMKSLATQTGSKVVNNVDGTTDLIANNGNQ